MHPSTLARSGTGADRKKVKRCNHLKGNNVKKILSLIVLAGVFFASPAFAADPVVGTWKLNVTKSKFNAGSELSAGTRV